MPFDPNEYLKKESTEEFNPDAYLSEEASPKSTAPSTQGGESGAVKPPLASTSNSADAISGDWTTEANPLKDKVQPPLVKPIDAVGQTKIVQPKKVGDYQPLVQENIQKIEGMTMGVKYPEYSKPSTKQTFDFKQASQEVVSEKEQAEKQESLNRKEQRRIENLPSEIESLRNERADLLLDKSPEAKRRLAANEAVTQKMQSDLDNISKSKYESLQNLNQKAVKGVELEVNEYLDENPKLRDEIKVKGLTDTETYNLVQQSVAKKIAPLEADLQIFQKEGTVDAAKNKIKISNELYARQEKIEGLASQLKSYQDDYLNKAGFSDLNNQLNSSMESLKKYEPALNKAKAEVSGYEKELNQIKSKLDTYQSKVQGNSFNGTQQEFNEYKALEKDYNETINDLNNVYKNESLKGYEAAVANYNSLAAKRSSIVKGLNNNEYNAIKNQYDSKIAEYDLALNDYKKFEEPEIKDRINKYFSTIQKIGEYDQKVKTTRGELAYVEDLEKAKEKFNNSGIGGDALDIGGRAVNSILDAAKKLVASPFRIAGSMSDVYGSGSDVYHYSDFIADTIEGKGSEKLFLTKEKNDFYNAKSDKINWGVIPVLSSVADQMGILLTLAATGKVATPVVQRALTTAGADLTAAAEIAESAKIATTIAPAFMISYGDNYKEALEKGFSGEGAMAYSGALSLLEGLTETILPDQDLIFGKEAKGVMLNRFIKDYAKGKKFAIKNLANDFMYNALGESTEEGVAALGKTLATSIGHLVDNDIEVEIPTMNQNITTSITAGLSAGVPGLIGSAKENSQMYKMGVMQFANDFEAGKALLSKLNEKGKIDDKRYNKLISDVQKFQSVRSQIPQGLSNFKTMAIAEKMIAIKDLSSEMDDDKLNPFNKINAKKIDAIQGEIEQIIDDKNFDARAEYELNLEAEELGKPQEEKQETAVNTTLKKNTSPTNEKYGTVNRNDGKGIVDLTKEEFDAEQANTQSNAKATAPIKQLTDEQIENNEIISNRINQTREILEKDILSEEEFIKETEGKKGKFRKGLERLFGEGNYDGYLIQQKNNLALLDKDPLAYYEKKLSEEIKYKKENPEDANDYSIGYYEDIIDRIKQQQATPEAKAGDNITPIEDEKNIEQEEGLQEVTPIEGVVEAAPIQEVYDRTETIIPIDNIGEGFVLHRGSNTGGVEGFNSLDKSSAEGYAGEGGKVESSKIKKGAKILRLVTGDTNDYSENKADIDEFYRILGEEERNKKSEWVEGNEPSDITTRLWNNPEAVQKLKDAGIDIVIGNTIDGADAFVVNKDAVESINNEQSDVNIQQPMGESKVDVEAVGDVAKEELPKEEVKVKSLSEVAAENIFNETNESVSEKIKSIQSEISNEIKNGIKKWGSKKGYYGEEYGNQSEKEIDIPNYTFSDKRNIEGSEYNKDLSRYRKLKSDAAKLHDIASLVKSDLSTENTSDLKKRLGSIVFNFHLDGQKKLLAKEADNIISELNKRGENVNGDKIIDSYYNADADENQIQQMKNNSAEITNLISTPNENNPTPPSINGQVPQPSIEVNKDDNKVETKDEVTSEGEQVKPKTAKEIAKEKLDEARAKFRKAQGLTSGGLNALPEFINLVKAAIEYGIVSSKEFLKEFRSDIAEKYSDSEVEAAFDSIVNPPSGEKPSETPPKKRKKALLNRGYEGVTREDVKQAIKEMGLDYEVESRDIAKADAKAFIERVGIKNAIKAVRTGKIVGARAAFVWAEAIDSIENMLSKARSESRKRNLSKALAELMDEFTTQSREGGRFISALADIYATSDFPYKLTNQIEKYKAINNGIIPKDIVEKFEQYEKELNELNEQIKAAEERAKLAEEQAAVNNIKEDINRPKETQTYSQMAKKAADSFRKRFKTKPKFFDENGNEIEIFTAGFTWNDLVELAAKAIEKSGNVADGLKAVSDYVKESGVYKSLSKKSQNALDKQINEQFGEKETDGKLKIKHSLIRELVEQGNNDIDSLTAAVKEAIKDEYPNATDREVRDAITGYGKTVNQNQEEIEKEIRKIKFIGKYLSALEDIAQKKRPLKSGAQRDKLTAEQRQKLKEIREAMKDLPIDLETQESQLKTALDAAKSRVRNRIEDLQREIDTKEQTKKNNKELVADEELKTLIEQRDALQYAHDLIFKGRPQTAGEKRIASLQKKLDDLMFKTVKGEGESAVFTAEEQKRIDDINEQIAKAKADLGLIKSKPLPKTEMEKAEAREQAKIDKLQTKLDELKQGIVNEKEAKERIKESKEVADLREQIEREKQLLGLIEAAPTQAEKTELAIDAAIEETERKIRENDLAYEKANKVTTPEIEAKREILKASKEALNKLREEVGLIEKRRLENAKKAAQRRINELERRIREKDFSKKKSKPLIQDTELVSLNAKKLVVKGKFDKLQYENELRNRSAGQKFIDGLIETVGITRALRATGEFSFMLIQGGVQSIANPSSAFKAFVNAMNVIGSEKKANEMLSYIQAQEFYPRMKASKLALTEVDAKLTAREEQFLSGWVNHVFDMLGYPLKAFGERPYEMWKNFNPMKMVERAGVAYLNTLRIEKYLQGEQLLAMEGKTFQNNPQDYKNLSNVINTLTGRASLATPLEANAKYLSLAFFSARNWASLLNQTILLPLWLGRKGSKPEGEGTISLLRQGKIKPSVAQKIALIDYGKYLALAAGLLAMASVGDDDEKDKEQMTVSFDPLSADFLKIKLGNTRIDLLGGRQQQILMFNRLIADLYKREGQFLNILGRTTRNKLAPTMSMAVDYVTASYNENKVLLDPYGKEYNWKNELTSNLYPIYIDTFIELHKEQPLATAVMLDAFSFIGGSTQTYVQPMQFKDSIKKYFKEINYKPSIDKRMDEDFIDLQGQPISEDDYTKFVINVNQKFNDFLDANLEKVKNMKINVISTKLTGEQKEEKKQKIRKRTIAAAQNSIEKMEVLTIKLRNKKITKEEYDKEIKKVTDKIKKVMNDIDKGVEYRPKN